MEGSGRGQMKDTVPSFASDDEENHGNDRSG
jgi:hypothetical protein